MKIIFDLENTISNSSHRMHLLYNCKHKEFQNEFQNDSVNENIKLFMNSIYRQGYKIVILTSKLSKYKLMVIKWLEENDVSYDQLIMKHNMLDCSDIEFKEEYIKRNKTNIIFAYDDVGKNCALFAKYNIPCLRIEQK